ncbi:unnamed protein product [Chondrus crispus]|uniref:RRM domain-containing protein n=1 Tax=Chondrus crispus TaxID=2769 RepID=R7QRZ0_CHOCR|nr:unnamed protein product [Chondrus crispus]CDF40145.1 unnamed protein product [Chondrus crispus]|eukprot:XP_005710439.1 unnamed protein product [Chondrus crispus]
MKKVEAIRKLNETELEEGIAGTSASWHQKYESCPFIYVGGLPTALTEGDLLAMFEQFGIVVLVNLVREADTGKSRGFAFLKYHDPRSAVLAVDNFTGTEVGGRTLRVDHAEDFKIPNEPGRGIIDTTPPQLRAEDSSRPSGRPATNESNANEITAVVKKETEKEDRRERAVFERWQAMNKKREREERKRQRRRSDKGHPAVQRDGHDLDNSIDREANVQPPNGEVNRETRHARVSESRIEKRRHKEERRARKAERAKLREERKRRRAEREGER